MRISSHKSLIREIAPGVIQIGNNPFAPSLSLNDLTKKAQVLGDNVLTEGSLEDIEGNSLDYNSATIDNAIFLNRPQAENKNVLIEGDLEPLSIQIENTGTLFQNSLLDASGLLAREISDSEDLLNNSLSIVSGILADQIEASNTEISNIQQTLDNTNISGVTYEQAEALAKKWSIILG